MTKDDYFLSIIQEVLAALEDIAGPEVATSNDQEAA